MVACLCILVTARRLDLRGYRVVSVDKRGDYDIVDDRFVANAGLLSNGVLIAWHSEGRAYRGDVAFLEDLVVLNTGFRSVGGVGTISFPAASSWNVGRTLETGDAVANSTENIERPLELIRYERRGAAR